MPSDQPPPREPAAGPTRTIAVPPRAESATIADSSVMDSGSSRVGQRFGRFEVVDVLGSGGMGTVFEAKDTTLDRPVALKLLHPDVDAQFQQRLLREAKALAKVSHPNVVQIFEAGLVDERAFIAMELVRGQDLAQWQMRTRPWRECVDVYLQAARGLAAAHAQGLLHRDFKPGNCILDERDRVRVLDFGLARALDRGPAAATEEAWSDDAVRTADGRMKPGTIKGTLGYMSLEQLWRQPLDAHSDQFSLCVSLFETIYGRRPFSGASLDDLVDAMVENRIDLPPGSAALAPRRLRAALERGLRAKASERFGTMDELIAELESLRVTRRRRAWWGGAAVLSIAVAGAGLWASSSPDPAAACEDLGDAWTPQRHEWVADGLASVDPELASVVPGELEIYAQRWTRARRATCAAERSAQTDPTALATRRQCLDEARDALDELGRLLAESEPELAAASAGKIRRLPAPEACEQPERFAPHRPLPDDPEQAELARTLRVEGRRAELQHQAGRASEALDRLDRAIVQAQSLDFGPVLAELELLRGSALVELGRYDDAKIQLEQAYARAVEHRFVVVELRAASALAYLVGDLLDQHEAGLKWGLSAKAIAQQPWVDPPLRHFAIEIVGNIYYEQGRYAQALEHYRQSFAAREADDPQDPMLTVTSSNIGLVLLAQGRYEDALPVLYEVLQHRIDEHGPLHASVAHSALTLGIAQHRLGQLGQAQRSYEQSIIIAEAVLPYAHPQRILILVELGRLQLDLADPGRALDSYERGLDIAMAVLGPNSVPVAECWLGLGRVLAAQGQLGAAQRHAERGVRILELQLGAEHVELGGALVTLGQIESRVDSQLVAQARARDHLERAVEILERSEGPPARLADARFALGQFLALRPEEQQTAVQLVRAAARGFEALGEVGEDRAAAARQWLADSSAP
ncbi:MAG: serine/threonine-protein kinase [Nannocystaceae bacterium]